MSQLNELWVERYRPKSIDEYVFRDKNQKNQIQEWIINKTIPNLLLSGTQGIGKTSLALLLFKELDVNDFDILKINASDDNSVETIRTRVTNFVSTMPQGDFRYILLDEADYLTHNAQAVLRGLIENSSGWARFILTCNYPEKIMPALHSRLQGFNLTKLDKDEFLIRIATILAMENMESDVSRLDTYVRATYPDLRKCIQSVQQNCYDGVLQNPDHNDIKSESDYFIEMVNLFKQGKINQARKLICSKARPEEFDNIYKFLYQNLELWGNEQNQEAAILIIRDGLYKASFVADAEINLSATLVQLAQLVENSNNMH